MTNKNDTIGRMFERLKCIPEFTDRDVEHKSKCVCGGTITSIISTYDGHLHAECDSCGWNMEFARVKEAK